MLSAAWPILRERPGGRIRRKNSGPDSTGQAPGHRVAPIGWSCGTEPGAQ